MGKTEIAENIFESRDFIQPVIGDVPVWFGYIPRKRIAADAAIALINQCNFLRILIGVSGYEGWYQYVLCVLPISLIIRIINIGTRIRILSTKPGGNSGSIIFESQKGFRQFIWVELLEQCLK